MKYKKVMLVLASIVVFMTTYALVLPAITVELQRILEDDALGISLEHTTETSSVEEITQTDGSQEMSTAQESTAAIVIEETGDGEAAAVSGDTQAVDGATSSDASDRKDLLILPEYLPLIEEETTLSYEADEYTVSATFDTSAKFPQGIELNVAELDESLSEYDNYRTMVDSIFSEEVGRSMSFVQLLDIHFSYDGIEYQPQGEVKITIAYTDGPEASEEDNFQVVHFKDEDTPELFANESTSTEKLEDISVTTDTFSIYAVVRSSNTDIATIENKSYYTVNFHYVDETGATKTQTVLLEAKSGAKLGKVPQNPFVSGKKFIEWRLRGTTTKVDANTAVTGNMDIDAYFEPIGVYTITLKEMYFNHQRNENVVFDSIILEVEEEELPKTLVEILPPSIKVDQTMDNTLTGEQEYINPTTTVNLTKAGLDAQDARDGLTDKQVVYEYQYRARDTRYFIYYYLRNQDGSNEVALGRVPAYGVLDEVVRIDGTKIPDAFAAQLANARFETADSGELYDADQVYNVYFTRNKVLLTYNTAGGDYMQATEVNSGDTINLQNIVPVREGYVFDGWYTTANYQESSRVSSIKVDTHQTIYAKWRQGDTRYTVIYHKEVYNTEGTASDYEVHEVRGNVSGVTGTSINGSNQPIPNAVLPFYYELDTTRNEQAANTKVVAADGSTIVNVYYKLKSYDLQFNVNTLPALSNTNRNRYPFIFMNNTEYRNSDYVIRGVKVGQNIAKKWPSIPSSANAPGTSGEIRIKYPAAANREYRFALWVPVGTTSGVRFKTDRILLAEEMLPRVEGNVQTYTALFEQNLNVTTTVQYFFQSPTNAGSYEKKYEETIAQKEGIGMTAKPFPGYTYMPSKDKVTGNTVAFYYDLNKYNINYLYNGRVVGVKTNILKGTNINTTEYNYTPTHASMGVDSDYTWGGWYEDASLNAPAFNGNTPEALEADKVLYAKWIPPTYRISFNLQGGRSSYEFGHNLQKGQKVISPREIPTREFYDFKGWYDAPTGGNLFDFNSNVTGNKTVYAQWIPKPLQYTVKYVNKATGQSLVEDKVVKSESLSIGQSITERATAILGYRPEAVELSKTLQVDPAQNIITFYYVPKTGSVNYTIHYVLDSNPNKKVLASRVETAQEGLIEAVELAKAVDKAYMRTQGFTSDELLKDYYPTENTKKLVLSANAADNVITFRYVDYNTSIVTLRYVDMDGTPIVGVPEEKLALTNPSSLVSADKKKEINGYTFAKLVDNNGVENKSLYQIDGNGNLVLTYYYRKNLELIPADKEKVYDGTALSLSQGAGNLSPSYTSSLKSGHRISAVQYTGSITNAGETSSSIVQSSVRIVDAQGRDKTSHYVITTGNGRLRVTPKPLTVTVRGETKREVYSGTEKSITYTVSIPTTTPAYTESKILYEGRPITNKVTLRQKNVGLYTLDLMDKFRNNDPNYNITFVTVNGALDIVKKDVSIRSEDAQKAYDATPLTSDSLITEGFVAGEGVTASFTGTITDPGTAANTFTYVANAGTDLNNYQITLSEGTLTVLPTVNIQKTNMYWEALGGARFALEKFNRASQMWESIIAYADFPVGADGFNIEGLATGQYRLRELQAPNGYLVLTSYIYLNVNETNTAGGKRYTVTIESGDEGIAREKLRIQPAAGVYSNRIQAINEHGTPLPNTGGIGIHLYRITGIFLIFGSMLFLWYARQKAYRRRLRLKRIQRIRKYRNKR